MKPPEDFAGEVRAEATYLDGVLKQTGQVETGAGGQRSAREGEKVR